MPRPSEDANRPTVLLAEDSPSHAELIVRSLQRNLPSLRIQHLADGESVLDYLFRRGDYADPATSPRPRVLFLDLRLPRIDGLEVLQQIKSSELLRRVPVVVLTTSTAMEDIAKAYVYQVNSVVGKPTDFAEFTRLMEDLATYWCRWNQDPWDGDDA